MPYGYKLGPAAQGNLACRRIFRSKSVVLLAEVIFRSSAGNRTPLAPPMGELSSAVRLRESPHYKMQGFDNGSSLHLCEKELDVTRRRE